MWPKTANPRNSCPTLSTLQWNALTVLSMLCCVFCERAVHHFFFFFGTNSSAKTVIIEAIHEVYETLFGSVGRFRVGFSPRQQIHAIAVRLCGDGNEITAQGLTGADLPATAGHQLRQVAICDNVGSGTGTVWLPTIIWRQY